MLLRWFFLSKNSRNLKFLARKFSFVNFLTNLKSVIIIKHKKAVWDLIENNAFDTCNLLLQETKLCCFDCKVFIEDWKDIQDIWVSHAR